MPEISSGAGAPAPAARSDATEPQPKEGLWVTFEIDGERFRAVITRDDTIQAVLAGEGREEPPAKIPSGRLAPGGDFNLPWSWHLVPETVVLNEPGIAIPECVVRPSVLQSEFLNQCVSYSPPARVVEVKDCRSGTCG